MATCEPGHRHYAPYYREGKLHLPPPTVNLLIEAGLPPELGRAALAGLALDEREQIAAINHALEKALRRLERSSVPFRTLSSTETRFLLNMKTFSG